MSDGPEMTLGRYVKGAAVHLAMILMDDVNRWTGLFKRTTAYLRFKNDEIVFGRDVAQQVHNREGAWP